MVPCLIIVELGFSNVVCLVLHFPLTMMLPAVLVWGEKLRWEKEGAAWKIKFE